MRRLTAPNKIAKLLAEERWLLKYQIMKKTRLSYSRVHEGVQHLEKSGMITSRYAGKAKTGLPKKEYSLTLFGLASTLGLEMRNPLGSKPIRPLRLHAVSETESGVNVLLSLGELSPLDLRSRLEKKDQSLWDKFDRIVFNYSDLHIIFKKWPYFKRSGVAGSALELLQNIFFNVAFGIFPSYHSFQKFLSSGIEKMSKNGVDVNKVKQEENEVEKKVSQWINERIKQDIDWSFFFGAKFVGGCKKLLKVMKADPELRREIKQHTEKELKKLKKHETEYKKLLR